MSCKTLSPSFPLYFRSRRRSVWTVWDPRKLPLCRRQGRHFSPRQGFVFEAQSQTRAPAHPAHPAHPVRCSHCSHCSQCSQLLWDPPAQDAKGLGSGWWYPRLSSLVDKTSHPNAEHLLWPSNHTATMVWSTVESHPSPWDVLFWLDLQRDELTIWVEKLCSTRGNRKNGWLELPGMKHHQTNWNCVPSLAESPGAFWLYIAWRVAANAPLESANPIRRGWREWSTRRWRWSDCWENARWRSRPPHVQRCFAQLPESKWRPKPESGLPPDTVQLGKRLDHLLRTVQREWSVSISHQFHLQGIEMQWELLHRLQLLKVPCGAKGHILDTQRLRHLPWIDRERAEALRMTCPSLLHLHERRESL